MQSLLKEKISIRNIIPIFETIAAEEKVPRKGIPNLYEKIRLSIAPQIIASLIEKNCLKFFRLNQKLTEYLFDNGNEIINYYVCERELIEFFSREYNEKIEKLNTTPVVICASSIRHIMKAFF